MRNYFANMVEAWALKDAFTEISTTFASALPALTTPTRYIYQNDNILKRIDHRFQIPVTQFLEMMAQIERMCFIDDPKTAHTYNVASYKPYEGRFTEHIERVSKEQFKTGFILCQAPGTKFNDDPSYVHLPAAENQFKVIPTHFLKIFTINDALVVYTNKDLPIDTIIKLKILQWNMFKTNIENPRQEIDDLLNALYTRDTEKGDIAIDKLLKTKELQDIKYEDLKDLFKPNYELKLRNKEATIASKQNDYIRIENQLSQLVRDIEELQEEVIVLQTMSEAEYDATPIIKHLIKHPYIKEFKKINSESLQLYFESPLVYYDDYIIDRIYRNYSNQNKTILRAFKDGKYELMTRCRITFNTVTFNVTFDTIGSANIIGHPHIDRAHCFGNHRAAIHDCAKEGDHLGAIEQISQATLNINFADSFVVRAMFDTLTHFKYLQTWRSKETGAMLSTEEILEIYNEEA